MSAVKDNLDQPKFDEAMDEWLSWGNEVAPDLHSMSTSLLTPDVGGSVKLHAGYSGTYHKDFGDQRLIHATQFPKGYAEHTREARTSIHSADGPEPQKYLSNQHYLSQLDIPIQPSSVVDPKYLIDTLDTNNPSKPGGSAGVRCPQFPESEALSINERCLEPSTAITNSAYIFPGILDFSPHLGTSVGNVAFGSDAAHTTSMSPLSAPIPFAGPTVYKYGNDTSFVRNGFYNPSNQKSDREITGYSPNFLDCLEQQNNLSSPNLDQQTTAPGVYIGSSDLDETVPPDIDGNEVKRTRVGVRSRRRRKTRTKDKITFPLEQDHLRHQRRSSKLASNEHTSQPPSGSFEDPCLRTSSHQSAKPSKPSRQNLSSEQRRANHIGSEKQRRDAIQGLEDELRRIVPVLRNSVFSKAEILEEAGKWLESLIEGNRILEARLGKSKSSRFT